MGTPQASNGFIRALPSQAKIPALGGMGAGKVAKNRNGKFRRGITILTVDFDRGISVTVEYLFGLDRETDCNLGATVENLKDMTTKQTVELAPDSLFGNQFDAAITRVTFGTSEVGLSHARYSTIFSAVLDIRETTPRRSRAGHSQLIKCVGSDRLKPTMTQRCQFENKSLPYRPSPSIWTSPRPVSGEVLQCEFTLAISERTTATLTEQFAVISRRRCNTHQLVLRFAVRALESGGVRHEASISHQKAVFNLD
jgi:hypothetical protein